MFGYFFQKRNSEMSPKLNQRKNIIQYIIILPLDVFSRLTLAQIYYVLPASLIGCLKYIIKEGVIQTIEYDAVCSDKVIHSCC